MIFHLLREESNIEIVRANVGEEVYGHKTREREGTRHGESGISSGGEHQILNEVMTNLGEIGMMKEMGLEEGLELYI